MKIIWTLYSRYHIKSFKFKVVCKYKNRFLMLWVRFSLTSTNNCYYYLYRLKGLNVAVLDLCLQFTVVYLDSLSDTLVILYWHHVKTKCFPILILNKLGQKLQYLQKIIFERFVLCGYSYLPLPFWSWILEKINMLIVQACSFSVPLIVLGKKHRSEK